MLPLDEALVFSPQKSAASVALDDALNELAGFDSRKAQTVELRYFGGLSVEEAAESLGVHPKAQHLIATHDWIKMHQLLNRAVVNVRHDTSAAGVHKRLAEHPSKPWAGLGDVPANPHPNDEIRAYPRVLSADFCAALCPMDLYVHGPERIGGLGMFDHLGG